LLRAVNSQRGLYLEEFRERAPSSRWTLGLHSFGAGGCAVVPGREESRRSRQASTPAAGTGSARPGVCGLKAPFGSGPLAQLRGLLSELGQFPTTHRSNWIPSAAQSRLAVAYDLCSLYCKVNICILQLFYW